VAGDSGAPTPPAQNEPVTQRRLFRFVALGGVGLGFYGLLVRGSLTVDLGIGRTVRPLGPLAWRIAWRFATDRQGRTLS
jgi:hypothetical protein